MEDGYNDTAYHSKAHAADVLQSMHTLLTLGGLASRMDDELVMLAGKHGTLFVLQAMRWSTCGVICHMTNVAIVMFTMSLPLLPILMTVMVSGRDQ